MNWQIETLTPKQGPFGRRRMVPSFLAFAVVAGLAGCDGLLDVDLPGQLPAEAIADPSMADVLINSVQADFECAVSNFAAFTSLYTDEMQSSSSFGPSVELIDLRLPTILNGSGGGCTGSTNSTPGGWYLPLQTARVQARDAFEIISGHADNAVTNKTLKLAMAAMYEGFSLAFLGEGFCEMSIDEGPTMATTAVLALAEGRFSEAITLAQQAGGGNILNAALVGRARARLGQGKAAEAAADAEMVPDGFIYYAQFDDAPGRRTNRVQTVNQVTRHMSVDPVFRNLTVGGVPDPRVDVLDAGFPGSDGSTALWITNKYPSPAADIPMAKWEEAQLIIAEARGGQEAVAAINRIRDVYGLPHFASSDAAAIRAEILEERRRVMFLEGRRIGDLVMYPELSFQTGLTHKGNSYNDDLQCLRLPNAEVDNNPNI